MSTADQQPEQPSASAPTEPAPDGAPTEPALDGAAPEPAADGAPTEPAPDGTAPEPAEGAGMASEAAPTSTPTPTAEELERIAIPATLRHAPRYRAFVVAGIVVGLLAAVVVVLLGQGRTEAGTGVVLAFVTAVMVLVGAALGAVVAVLVDRRTRR